MITSEFRFLLNNFAMKGICRRKIAIDASERYANKAINIIASESYGRRIRQILHSLMFKVNFGIIVIGNLSQKIYVYI